VEHDVPQEPGSKLGPGTSVFHQRIISDNSYAIMNRKIIAGRKKRV